jgi:hypothetical protein
MSFVVLAIGAAHALPPIIGAVLSQSKAGAIIGAVVGGFVAILSGNPAFIAVDLIGVGVGTWLGLSIAGAT